MEKTTVIQYCTLERERNLIKSPYIDGRASDVVVSHNNRVADYCNLLITYNVS